MRFIWHDRRKTFTSSEAEFIAKRRPCISKSTLACDQLHFQFMGGLWFGPRGPRDFSARFRIIFVEFSVKLIVAIQLPSALSTFFNFSDQPVQRAYQQQQLYLHDHTNTYSIAKPMFRNQNYSIVVSSTECSKYPKRSTYNSLIRTDQVIELRTPAFELFQCPFTIFHKVSKQ